MSSEDSKPRVKVQGDAELGPKASIVGTLLSLWGVICVLTIYAAPSVANELAGWERLSALFDSEPVSRALEGLQKATGLEGLHTFLEARRQQINDTYAVGRLEDTPVAPPEPPGPVDPEVPGADRPAHRRAPSKQRVLVIGASSIQFALGVELERAFPRYEKVKVKRFGQLATSLARPDFFNWQEKAKTLIGEFKPDLVVTNFGGNDAQDILRADGSKVLYSSPEWEVAFEGLVTELIELGRSQGADTVMIGMPVMREDPFTEKMRRLNASMKKATEAAGALYVSTWELSSNAKGEYLTQVSFGGKRGLMRTSDGVHYSKLGAQLVVEATLELIERRFHFVPADPTLGPAEPHAFESKRLARWVPYVVYRPRPTEEVIAERPLILLDLGDAPTDLTPGSHPHRRLQAWAQAEGVNLVHLSSLADLGGEEVRAPFFREELLADLEAHFPSGGHLGLVTATGVLAAAAAQDPAVPTVKLEGPWEKSLEAAVKKLSLELRPPPSPPNP
jgi:hypothetical protein